MLMLKDILYKIFHIEHIDFRAVIKGSEKIDISKSTKIHSFVTLQTFKGSFKPINRIKIGRDSEIRSYSFLFSGGGEINIGDDVFINSGTTILGGGGVNIGNSVQISPNVTISSSGHNLLEISKDTFNTINIGDRVWIGANSTVLQGVNIGEGAVIGAGSVVTKDIPSYSLAIGTPAKVIKSLKVDSNLSKVEELILNHFKNIPFHNLFMLFEIDKRASNLGGTCSDKTIQFKETLEKSGFPSKLHSSLINNRETHRLLKLSIDNQEYFIDIGTGWPTIKPFPVDKEISYSCCGIIFSSKLDNNYLRIFMKRRDVESGEYREEELTSIPLKSKPEQDILNDIKNRYRDTALYPFSNSLRYSFIDGDSFIFIRGDNKYLYRDDSVELNSSFSVK